VKSEFTIRQKFLGIPEAQAFFSLSRAMLYKLRERGKIKFYHLGAKPYVKVEELESLIESGAEK
jgi:hypothetical protein